MEITTNMMKSIDEANVDKDTEITDKDAEIKQVEEDTFNLALEKFRSYNLAWTFRSINYVLNFEHVSFGQLRSCVYVQDGQGVFNYIRSTLSLIKAGLIGSKQLSENDTDKLENRAYEIIEDWRESFGFIGTLHLFIINAMEEKHFFMGTADQAVLNHLSSKNSQPDLIKNLVMEDLEEKIRQAQALTQS